MFPVDPSWTMKSALDEVPLVPGWNLLSIPKQTDDTSPSALLETAGGAYTRVYAYDACATGDPWSVYDPGNPEAATLTDLDPTKGFWLDATLPVDLVMPVGAVPASTSWELCVGWNLIGFPAGQERPIRNALWSIEGKYIRVMAYDTLTPDDVWKVYDVGVPDWANDLDVLQPGRGYWVLVTEAATLTIANDGPEPVVKLTVPEDQPRETGCLRPDVVDERFV
jgi:hypothetical protein